MFGLATASAGSPGRRRRRRKVTVTANQIVSTPLPSRGRRNRNRDTRDALLDYLPVGCALASDTGLTMESSSLGSDTNPVHFELCAK
jgi:hypothetical protein